MLLLQRVGPCVSDIHGELHGRHYSRRWSYFFTECSESNVSPHEGRVCWLTQYDCAFNEIHTEVWSCCLQAGHAWHYSVGWHQEHLISCVCTLQEWPSTWVTSESIDSEGVRFQCSVTKHYTSLEILSRLYQAAFTCLDVMCALRARLASESAVYKWLYAALLRHFASWRESLLWLSTAEDMKSITESFHLAHGTKPGWCRAQGLPPRPGSMVFWPGWGVCLLLHSRETLLVETYKSGDGKRWWAFLMAVKNSKEKWKGY